MEKKKMRARWKKKKEEEEKKEKTGTNIFVEFIISGRVPKKNPRSTFITKENENICNKLYDSSNMLLFGSFTLFFFFFFFLFLS